MFQHTSFSRWRTTSQQIDGSLTLHIKKSGNVMWSLIEPDKIWKEIRFSTQIAQIRAKSPNWGSFGRITSMHLVRQIHSHTVKVVDAKLELKTTTTLDESYTIQSSMSNRYMQIKLLLLGLESWGHHFFPVQLHNIIRSKMMGFLDRITHQTTKLEQI